MRLVSATVTNYRSITSAYKIPIEQRTILIGPNNEGKSNILNALVLAMRTLQEPLRFRSTGGITAGVTLRRVPSRYYEWERDYPIQLQNKKPNGQSEITLEFQLNKKELREFREAIKSTLNGTLPIKISFGSDDFFRIAIVKQGPSSKDLNQKAFPIALFVSKKLAFEHIPAIRTASSARAVVETLVDRELSVLENNDDYKKLLSDLAALQAPHIGTAFYKHYFNAEEIFQKYKNRRRGNIQGKSIPRVAEKLSNFRK